MADSELHILQSNCRRDPESYRAEFNTQLQQYRSLVSATELQPSLENAKLAHLSSFMAHVSSVYPKEGALAAVDHAKLLKQYGASMHFELRRALVKSLAIMYRKNAVEIEDMVPVLFQLLPSRDKELRKFIAKTIISSVKFANKKHRNEKVNRALQKYLYKTIEDRDATLVKRSLNICAELFRKNIWNDERTANVIASAIFHPSPEVMLVAARFVLESDGSPDAGEDDRSDSDSEDDGDEKEGGAKRARDMWKLYNLTAKKNTKKTAKVQKAMKKMTKKKKNSGSTRANPFSAIMMLNNPQEYSEKLFSALQTTRKGIQFSSKLVLINLVGRLISTHELLLLNFYPFLQRYLRPSQEKVTLIMTYLAQGCHSLVPPDVVHPIVRSIADNFISDRCSEEAMAVGLNTVREICARVPLAIEVESEGNDDVEARAALLRDLVGFKGHRDKGVSMAARSLLQLYREVNPQLLLKKDRGRDASMNAHEAPKYGAVVVSSTIDGLQHLEPSSDSDKESDDDLSHEGDDPPQLVPGDDNGENSAPGDPVADDNDDDDNEDDDGDGDDDEDGDGDGDDDDDDDDASGDDDSGSEKVDDERGGSVATELATSRVLDDADFRRIRDKAAASDLQSALGNKRLRGDEALHVDDIESYKKKARRTLEERLESVRAGREGRSKFGSKKGRRSKTGGSSNRQKQKKKQGAMVMHKVRTKGKSKGGRQPRKKR